MPVFDRITIEPGKCGGEPCLRGLRIPVHLIVSLLAAGETSESVLANYPELELGDIRQALEFAAYHLKESIVPIRVAA
ncbi:MAG: hypothetical protein AUJ92_10240 [Armatimonadetes bacterium CG2_30_59_28]|nr:DUF433 domain-containing protein [Armatimonadota bacterium]OIO94395.1 MAG: hypothetical protein AUJ92_10240 [Armatimonadetes bacterium CG2_30_59_28]PIU60781.1 MAG: hypothetical protein COS85_22700 [Armatimonadetes bacterium CG07_land_8_20_14_0_80_59_28]PIX38624.1 MAG: hypothetical protein COZ56_19900 [Armatimonadetes bacterium CG_4_8_14_3_um_filter_58_9]PIY40605.1 MAG: hypothetical protein COZ05_17215 [Armatimonadetes bacterium CG_4_10_14_3_um_filter_59_10]PJB66489.1 MAG: hypothetical prote